MDRTPQRQRLNFYSQVIIVLLGLIAVRLWMMPVDALPRAQAQFMDSGAVRLQLVRVGERTNTLLEQIQATLKGTLRVQVDDRTPPSRPPTRTSPTP